MIAVHRKHYNSEAQIMHERAPYGLHEIERLGGYFQETVTRILKPYAFHTSHSLKNSYPADIN